MSETKQPLQKEDYEEPQCLLCTTPAGKPKQEMIPQQRISRKLDEYMGRKDFAGGQRHLIYWLQEAQALGDERGAFMVLNEMMGFYRKTGKREEAVEAVEKALAMIPELEAEGSISAGTCYVNIGTVFNTFHEDETALPYFEKAQEIYEAKLTEDDSRLGGLYNNMALVQAGLGRYEEANTSYAKALAVMEKVPDGEIERAMTYLNLANAAEAQIGLEYAGEVIDEYLEEAEKLLKTPNLPKDSYLAFVIDLACDTFEYYGWFQAAQDLKKIKAECVIR